MIRRALPKKQQTIHVLWVWESEQIARRHYLEYQTMLYEVQSRQRGPSIQPGLQPVDLNGFQSIKIIFLMFHSGIEP